MQWKISCACLRAWSSRYGPGIPHDFRNSGKRLMEKYFVMLAGDEVRKRLIPPAPRPGEIIQSSAPAHILQLFEDLIDAGRRAKLPIACWICRMIMEHMLLRIAETAVPLGTLGTEAFETFQRCRVWIEEHYRGVSSLPEIAAQCRADPAYICRLFKRYSHHTPWQYVLRLKMRDAAQRLQSQQIRVSQVAYEFGFDDPFQFSRTFKRLCTGDFAPGVCSPPAAASLESEKGLWRAHHAGQPAFSLSAPGSAGGSARRNR